MKSGFQTIIFAFVLIVVFAASVLAADNTLYGVELSTAATQRIFTINQTTGAATAVAAATLTFTSAAAARRASDGVIFYTEYTDGGLTTRGRVATWNPATGAKATLATIPGTQFIRLAFDNAGTLYAMNQNNQLYTINTGTGAAALLGAVTGTGLITNGGGDITFAPNGTMYLQVGNNLYTVNISTRAASLIGGGTYSSQPTGLAFGIDGNLYATVLETASSNVYRINLATGAAALIGASGAPVGDLAGMPKFAELQMTKTANGSFIVGQNATYTLSVKNNGPQTPTATAAEPITVSDVLANGLTFVSATGTGWTCGYAGATRTVNCTGTTAPAAGATMAAITLTVTVGSAAASSVSNTAGVSSTTFDHLATDNSSTATAAILAPDLTIAKTHTENFTRGSTGTYTITVTNSGTAATSGMITVTDNLPAGLSVNGGLAGTVAVGGANAAGWLCTSNLAAPQTITCTGATAISNAAGGNTSVFSFAADVSLLAAASVTNNADVSGGNEAAFNAGNNAASDPTAVGSTPPNIELLKSCPSPANCTTAPQLSGTELTYQIQFTNKGGQTATALTILDAIPLNTDFKIGTAQANAGTSGLIFTIEYSKDYNPANPLLATWLYLPENAGGGAAAGGDRNVKAIRWRVTGGTLSNIAPNNTGNVSFTVRIR